ncbi:Phosphodiesterase/alkaline phosphatase D [Arcticibacter svalbardensis MN12-7]|uniref:Phosphodiesterase/alkaline phosphatase D n=1 Tax=Arcticibacter svalbardensis MN12-7 TaxID=1150600 RepID=R9GVG8_9SPHI|nr:alkaline phosphatase D family protein [Arcticibacter svalbardensis]EOR95525.1 Phosphodiesterase/alkaline phosphatase D [Arcticibacter svalbardensis MN12-7]
MNPENLLKKLSRRKFLRNSVIAATGIVLLPSAILSCKKTDDDNEVFEGQGFNEGVASFDPSQDKVILWTRYTPAVQEQSKPTIVLDVAKDKDFNTVVVSQSVEVDTNSDYTVYVDVSQLTSNTKYYYRFRNEKTKAISVTGETKTLPATGEVSEVKLAVVSCANFQAGLFNVYGAVAESDADVVVHLGDYIYEYPVGSYGSNASTVALNRLHQPAGEIIKVEEYRERYRQYRSDEQLQKAHQLKPFICVWDDHEIANNAYKDGAENHQANEGDFNTRKMSAIQVWHEYLPARVQDNAKIYRGFEIGGLVNLMMLDTRIIGRDKQLDYADYLTSSGLNSTKFLADWQNPQRTILGQEQKSWLVSKINTSTCKWQVLGNQVLMGKMFIPAEQLLLTAQISSGSTDPALLAQYNKVALELVTIKTRMLQNDPTLTAAEKARVQTVLPYNLDAWDGYPAEREMIYAAIPGKKIVSLAGDTHNAWYSVLSDSNGRKVGAEFATSSITSPGFEAIFGSNPQTITAFEQVNTLLIDDLQYVDASKRGYVMAAFTANEAKAEWRYVSTILSKSALTVTGKTVMES